MKKLLFTSAAIGVAVWLLGRDKRRHTLTPSWPTRQKVSGTVDELKGKGKQTAGDLLNEPHLTAEGIVDQAVGAVKRGLGEAAGQVSKVLS